MSMSLSGVSSPLEQEPNSHAFFIGCVTKYCLIVFIVPISIITRNFSANIQTIFHTSKLFANFLPKEKAATVICHCL